MSSKTESLLASFSTRIAETAALRRAALEAQNARAEAELSIKARSEFLANMNHELRTPLNAIIGFATMLKEAENYDLAPEQRVTYAEYVLQSADLLLGHINTLLEAAALDGGDLSLEPGEIDMGDALAEAVKRAKIAADAATVTIDVKPGEATVNGWGDHVRVGQALDHILRTAIRFSPQDGRILVRAVVDDLGWAEIAVRDRGAGLSPEAVDKALSAFTEVHRGLDRSFAGPGIGLAIAKTFVEIQGGKFLIKSRVGEGTLVRIMLPPPREQTGAADVRLAG
ncbi:MAG: HAMP domain-containing sensor histidine kinase [Parvularculaceae bacterium]